ncbi:hypothetical protein B0H21DRAFT_409263 [Amylocystis lapponica]|nr:hypothetical protein B0H21DRAFT_409263 [Amylocystis lapponica]
MPRSHPPSPDLSLRHLPDISDTSTMPDFSDASFQIPRAGPSTDLLLADESMNFFGNDDTLSTPVRPIKLRNDAPLTLAELTPRSRPARIAPVRSSLRPRPGIPTPRRPAVAMNLAAALSEEFSPLRDTSFQIPVAVMGSDNLLDDDTSLAFGGADTTVTEAISSHEAQPQPPTLDQLSPKRSRMSPPPHLPSRSSTPLAPPEPHPGAHDNSDELGADQASPTFAIRRDTVRAQQPEMASPVHLSKAEAQVLSAEATDPSATKKAKARPVLSNQRKELTQGDKVRRKRAVIGGGITKATKPKLPRSTLVRGVTAVAKTAKDTSQRPRGAPVVHHALGENAAGPSRSVARCAETKEDSNSTGVRPTGGLAATLMSLGQRYMQETTRSEERDMNEDQAAAAASAASAASAPALSSLNASPEENRDLDHDRRLSLSQVSAQIAETPAPAHPVPGSPARPLSPTHPPIKRSTSAVPELSAARRKRSRTTPAPAASVHDFSSRQPSKAHTLQPSRAKNAAASATASSSQVGHRSVDPHANADIRAPSRSRSATRQLTDASSAPAASSSAGRSLDPRRSQRENVPERHVAQPQEGPIERYAPRSGLLSTYEKPHVALPAAKPTKPIEFHFQSDTRAEARKAELDKSSGDAASSTLRRSRRAPLPVPDFKALHAAQESLFASRREHIVPTVPLELELYTDVRAREREKFEEARRAREHELELQTEERRRLRELEEEKEIKELRKRAVPRANEIPDWYADAPKKAGKTKM